jgi:hypothetical protein
MVNNRRYKRHFIILENEDSGFGKTDKRMPKGYAKIEVRNGKGLLNVYVQDLKYFKDAKYIYRNYLISTKGKKGLYVNAGTFVIDEKGKGELKVKFNPDNVEGSGKPIEDFNVVAVIAQPIKRSSVEKQIYGPLVGYMDKEKVSWKNVLAYEENTVKEDPSLDKEYKEKYEQIINVIEKSSKELYKEDKDETKDYKKEEKKVEEKENKKEYKEHKKYDEGCYEDEGECVDSLEENDNGVNEYKNENNKDKVEEQAKPQKKEKAEAKAKPEKKEEVNPENKEAVEPEKKEAVEPEKKEAVEPEKKETVEPEKKETVEPEKKEAVESENKEAVESENKEAVESENKEAVESENKEAVEPEKKEAVESENKEAVKPEKKEKNTKSKKSKTKYYGKKTEIHYKKYHKMVYKYIKDMLKYYEKIQPFEKNIDEYKWWKMNYDKKTMHKGFLPFFGYVLSIYSYNPYVHYMSNCQNLMNMYGHYVFGIAYDNDMEPKYYVYGVPGRYLYKDQPFQGMTGFVCWYPLEDKEPEKGDYGYWLLHIDAMTGNVTFPMKPTTPPM